MVQSPLAINAQREADFGLGDAEVGFGVIGAAVGAREPGAGLITEGDLESRRPCDRIDYAPGVRVGWP